MWYLGLTNIEAADCCVSMPSLRCCADKKLGMQVAMNPQNTVFDAKRLIGRKFTDPSVQDDIKHWPFKVVDGPDHKPLIEGEKLSLAQCTANDIVSPRRQPCMVRAAAQKPSSAYPVYPLLQQEITMSFVPLQHLQI